MICTTIDNFYLTDEQLQNSPSRKDGIDEATETTLRIYGCDLIQESAILLRLPQAVMATGQVLFHRFSCKKSFARFDVKKSLDLKAELSRTEGHILKDMGFVCHVEHPHKFILAALQTPPKLRQETWNLANDRYLQTPPELGQEAWNLANDSLRTTLCVRFKSEVVACGVVYVAARRFQIPLPENPPWWKAFDAEKSGIDEPVPYITQEKDGKEVAQGGSPNLDADASMTTPGSINLETGDSKDAKIKAALEKLSDDESKSMPAEGEAREEYDKTTV